MNSIINLISTDANKSTVVVHKDGADFDVPVKNMFDAVLPVLDPVVVCNGLGLKFLTGELTNSDNFLALAGNYNTTTFSLDVVDLNATDPINYAIGEWGIVGNVPLNFSNTCFTITSGLKTAAQTVYFAFEPDTYNNFGGKQFIKYVIYNNTGDIITSPGNLNHSVLFIQIIS
jgi:hypothetical protein